MKFIDEDFIKTVDFSKQVDKTYNEIYGINDMTDNVNHPKHYTSHPSGIECIEITRHMNFNRGNAIKYIWRADDKGDTVENLKKAIWYLEDEILRLTNNPPQ